MPFTDVLPPVTGTAKTGISFSVSESKTNRVARLSFNETAQAEVFGDKIIGQKFFAKVGRGQDEGRLLLILADDGDLCASGGARGSACIKMKAWDLLPKGKVPAGAAELVEPVEDGFIFRLPSWTKPSGVGGKMEKEFGLKK